MCLAKTRGKWVDFVLWFLVVVVSSRQPIDEVFEDLENRFKYHAPKDGQLERYNQIRSIGFDFAKTLVGACPKSRELSLALTNLEQAIMWANASIARNEG